MVYPLTVGAMQEIGSDIFCNRLKSLDELSRDQFDYAITFGDQPNESCFAILGETQGLYTGIRIRRQ